MAEIPKLTRVEIKENNQVVVNGKPVGREQAQKLRRVWKQEQKIWQESREIKQETDGQS